MGVGAGGYRQLPEEVARLFAAIDPPDRLVAHHILVHDVACQLLEGIAALPPGLDARAVRFGAATHDIGKTEHRAELGAPGKEHEAAGRALLEAHGVEPALARFAVTHGLPAAADELEIEDLLVILADKCWKGKRVEALEERIARELAAGTGADFFDALLALADLVESIADAASARLAWQNAHGV